MVATGTIVGGVTLNPIPLGVISGTGLLLKTYSETKNFKKKIEMSKFAYTSYEKVLTHLRSFMRGLEYNDKEFLDFIKILDDIIIDMCPLTDKFEKNIIRCSFNNRFYFITNKRHNTYPISIVKS